MIPENIFLDKYYEHLSKCLTVKPQPFLYKTHIIIQKIRRPVCSSYWMDFWIGDKWLYYLFQSHSKSFSFLLVLCVPVLRENIGDHIRGQKTELKRSFTFIANLHIPGEKYHIRTAYWKQSSENISTLYGQCAYIPGN